MNKRSFWLGIVALAIVVILIAASRASAQDSITVCRDPRFPTGRIEFRGMPDGWNTDPAQGWWILADGSGYYPATEHYSNTIVADVLVEGEVQILGEGFPEWEQNIAVGDALIGNGDYTIILKGNAESPECDVSTSPVQEPGYTYPEPTPTTVPVPEPVQAVPVAEVVSTGRTCVVKYLATIILVCS